MIVPSRMIVPSPNITPSPTTSPPAGNPTAKPYSIWPSPSRLPSPDIPYTPDGEIYDNPIIDQGSEQEIPASPFRPPRSSASPEQGIINDPDTLPGSSLNEPVNKIIMEVLPGNFSSKYVIEERSDPHDDRLTIIKKIPLLDEYSEPEAGLENPEESFWMLLSQPDDPVFLMDDGINESDLTINTISNPTLNYILQSLAARGVKYAAIYGKNGTIQIKARYASGIVRLLSQEELLFIFGEWFNEFFDAFFESLYGYATPYSTYSSQSRYAVISHKKKKANKKGDPVKPDNQPVDGQGDSKPASGKSTPNHPKLFFVQPPKVVHRTPVPDPEPSYDKPELKACVSKNDGAALVASRKERIKPEHRFTVAKATSELAIDKELRPQGIKKLTKALKRRELKAKFKELDGFPKKTSANVQIRWLLDNGHAIELSELIVEKASQQWLDHTAHTLIGRHLERTRCHRRTKIKSSDSVHQNAELVKRLEAFVPEESVIAGKPKLSDHAVLKPLLKSGWRVVLANGKKAPLYNSAQQRQLLDNPKVSNIEDTLTVSTQRALEYLLWDSKQALLVGKLIALIVWPSLDEEMKQALESTPTQPGMIETALGISSYIRLVNHPDAGGGRLVLGPSQRHIKVSYFNNASLGEHVHIEISIEFSEITMANPMQEQTKVPMTIALRTVYQLPLLSGSATMLPEARVIVVSDPPLPPAPTDAQMQQWTTTLREKQTRLLHKSLQKTEERLTEWTTRESIRPPVDIAKLKEDSRKLKSAQQGFAKNFDYAKNWSELPLGELEHVAGLLTNAMKQYEQLLGSVLEDETLFSGNSHQAGWELVRDYKKYVQDMKDVYERMEQLNKQQEPLTSENQTEIEELVKMTEEIGGRARNLSGDKLPLRRTELKNNNELTELQYDRTEQLRTLYYPLTSAFNIAKAQTLQNLPQGMDETNYHRASAHLPDENQDNTPVIMTSPEISPVEVTMPFTFSDNSQEEYEADILQSLELGELQPDISSGDSEEGSSPEDD